MGVFVLEQTQVGKSYTDAESMPSWPALKNLRNTLALPFLK